MRRLGWLWLASVLACAALVLAVVVPLGPPWRPAAAVAFACVGPGASLVPLLGLKDRAMEFVLVMPVSFAVVILSAAALFYPGLWSPYRQLAILLAICASAQLWRLIVTRRGLPDFGLSLPDSGLSKLPVPPRTLLIDEHKSRFHDARDAAW